MADFEGSNSSTWRDMVEGQANLIEAIDRQLEFRRHRWTGASDRANELVA